MRKFILLTVFFISAYCLPAQSISGLWYSSDSTRVYEIKQTGQNKYTAILKSSLRQKDSVGYVVIKELQYNSRRKRYEGIIYSVTDGDSTFVSIRFHKKHANKIVLKLDRMFVFDVHINWIKV